MMLGYFPSPRPGELLYSVLARYSAALGSAGPKAIMRNVFDRANAIATTDLPNDLASLVKRLPTEFGIGCDELIERHTLFPYYTAFQSAAIKERARSSMTGIGGSLHLQLGISTFKVPRPAALQFCPECLPEMHLLWGTLHWRIAHQLPGVLVCADHGSRLRRSPVNLVSANRHHFAPAGEYSCPPGSPPIVAPLSGAERDHAIMLAEASVALLNGQTEYDSLDQIRDDYRASLARIGLVRGRLKIDQRSLEERLRAHYGSFLERVEGIQLDGAGVETWLASLVRTSTGAQPPLQHLVLRAFIGAQPDVPVTPALPYKPRFRDRPMTVGRRTRPARPRLDWDRIDREYATELSRVADEVRGLQPPRRVTLAAIESRLGRRDWLHKRVKKLPLSAVAAAGVIESTGAFQLRRLEWHVHRAVDQGLADPWIVLRRAGLSGKHISVARTMLASAIYAADAIAA